LDDAGVQAGDDSLVPPSVLAIAQVEDEVVVAWPESYSFFVCLNISNIGRLVLAKVGSGSYLECLLPDLPDTQLK